MKQKMHRTSGYDKEQLRRMKYASVESKFHALENMIAFTKEAQESCRKRGLKVHQFKEKEL
jgi:L-lactate utilization protein LutB